MATTSFTLRKANTGSYVQQTGATDGSLRADQVIFIGGVAAGTENTFSANIYNLYDEFPVILEWETTFSLGASAATPYPTEMAIVASVTGEPITIRDGALVTTITNLTKGNTFNDIIRVAFGRFVYYALFVKYYDPVSTKTWYEQVATLYLQIPKPYNSLDNLWSKIPQYYRELDSTVTDDNGIYNNPLFNFLELFGWETDRTRSLIDSLALSHDPKIAPTPALQALAQEFGLEIGTETLGTSKVRALLNNIGTTRRSKGTLSSISAYLSALTGSKYSYTTTGPASSPIHNFYIYANRVNFVPDPKFVQGASAPINSGTSGTKTTLTAASTWGVFGYGGDGLTNAASAVPTISTTGNKITITMPAGTFTNRNVLLYTRIGFPYLENSYLYTGFVPTISSGASFVNFHVAGELGWEATAGSTGASTGVVFRDTSWNPTPQYLATDPNNPNRRRIELSPDPTYPFGFGNFGDPSAYGVLQFKMDAASSVVIDQWIIEHYSLGDYFDGDSREGSLIPPTGGAYSGGTYDYRWKGNADQSFSVYTLDYLRTQTVTEKVIKECIVPVTIKDNIVFYWNEYLVPSIRVVGF